MSHEIAPAWGYHTTLQVWSLEQQLHEVVQIYWRRLFRLDETFGLPYGCHPPPPLPAIDLVMTKVISEGYDFGHY